MGFKVSDFYRASTYMSAADVGRQRVRASITSVSEETVGEDSRLVVYFDDSAEGAHESLSKGLVLNRTNAMVLADTYGDDVGNWLAKEVELYTTKTPYQGKMVDALRVRGVTPQSSMDEMTRPKK